MDIISEFKKIVGEANVLTEASDKAGYLEEWTQRFHGKALAVVRPASTGEVSAVLKLCNDNSISVVPQSGNTDLVGGSVPDDSGRSIVLSLTRMNKVENIDPINDTMLVEAGVILQRAQEAARDAGRLFPLSFAAQGTACLGGCLATNAGGTAVLRYGNTRELVLGLEVVLADGTVINMLRGLRKDNTGYDLKHLFLASEGTLGVITRAVVKLFPVPQAVYVAFIGVENPHKAADLLARLKSETGSAVTGFELMMSKCVERVAREIPAVHVNVDVSAAPWWCLVELSYPREPEANPLEAFL
jgi:FAD/FMN-containing dehydrogenase